MRDNDRLGDDRLGDDRHGDDRLGDERHGDDRHGDGRPVVRLSHRVRTTATPAQVWQVLGNPVRWPEFDPFLRRVSGARGPAGTGQHLLGHSRGLGVPIPVDVLEAVPERRLVLRVHVLPGVVEEVTHEVTPTVRGGSDLTVSVVVEGLFARAAVVPLWLARGLTSRVLGVRAEGLARAARRSAAGAA